MVVLNTSGFVNFNTYRVGYDRLEQIWEGGKRDCNCASSRNWNVSTYVAVTVSSVILFQYGTTRALNACLTPLLVNFQSMTSKPNAGGSSKDCVTWKVEEDMHNFLHVDKVTTDSSTD